MKFITLFISIIMLLNFFSFGQKNEHDTNKVFNEGVSLSLQAGQAHQKGDFELSNELNKKAIEKFRQTYKLDPSNTAIRSALGHCLYLDKQFPEAISWYEQANKVNGETAINFREIGLSKISIGKIVDGKAHIDKAFMLDKTNSIKQITIGDLSEIAELSFSYGEAYDSQKEPEKGKEYKKFSLTVYIIAYNYDKTNKTIATRISELADKFGDKETAAYYRKLSTE